MLHFVIIHGKIRHICVFTWFDGILLHLKYLAYIIAFCFTNPQKKPEKQDWFTKNFKDKGKGNILWKRQKVKNIEDLTLETFMVKPKGSILNLTRRSIWRIPGFWKSCSCCLANFEENFYDTQIIECRYYAMQLHAYSPKNCIYFRLKCSKCTCFSTRWGAFLTFHGML